MNSEIATSSDFYLATIEGKLAACFAVIHFPHPKERKFKRGHRLVVHPDYQGFGLGHALSSKIADMYKKMGFRFIITSNTKSLYKQRVVDSRWRVTRIGRTSSNDSRDKVGPNMAKTGSHNKITISYEYVG